MSRKNSEFPNIELLESCKKWQKSFFYVKNTTDEDLLNLPPFVDEPPTAMKNWTYNPRSTVGPVCCGFINRSAIGVGIWRFVEGGEHEGAIQDGGRISLPSFRSRNGGEILRAAIIHYMATSARLQ
jgi:hypothetical protein